ncbi:MAG: hypothetical protein C0399_10360 [Syntrophus sp. (in: bacteria)]|nr:hypothetical protein [Syntrophus sp. (in: bacteria)]
MIHRIYGTHRQSTRGSDHSLRKISEDIYTFSSPNVVLPTMNGKELEERIEKLKPGIEALFMSGYTVDIIARHGVLAEGVTFIQKPFMMDDFLRKVRKVLGHKHNIDKKRNPY